MAALDRNLPQIDASFRRRAIALSLLRLDELTETFHKAVRRDDIEAGNLMVRLEAERRTLLGLTGSNYGLVQLVANNSGEKSTARWKRAFERLGKWQPSPTNGESEAGPGEPADVGADKSS